MNAEMQDVVDVADIAQRVDAGVAVLDRRGPLNWALRINAQRLDITSTQACVVGQLYQSFAFGVDLLGVSHCSGDYGFAVAWSRFRPLTAPEFWCVAKALTEAWRAVIVRRQQQAALRPAPEVAPVIESELELVGA